MTRITRWDPFAEMADLRRTMDRVFDVRPFRVVPAANATGAFFPVDVLDSGDDIDEADVSEFLGRVSAPTLILHRRDDQDVPFEHAVEFSRGIPSARLVPLSGNVNFAGSGDSGSIIEAIDQFLRENCDGNRSGPEATPARGAVTPFRTVLFTDLVGHTEMMRRLGDDRGRQVLREHERITRELLQQHGGAEVKTMGDGFMASFGSVTSAMECAIALQRAFATHTESMPEPLHVRVGLNAGEPIEEDGDLFGATVILASRIAAKAGAGEILVPDTVRGLLSGKGFVFGDRGEFVPKGFDEGVRLWEVRWTE